MANDGGASIGPYTTTWTLDTVDSDKKSHIYSVAAGDTITIKVEGKWVQMIPYYTDNKDTAPDYAISGFSGMLSGGCQMTITLSDEGFMSDYWIMDSQNEGYP
jgi:endonuclease YncB( thermonuclease family)